MKKLSLLIIFVVFVFAGCTTTQKTSTAGALGGAAIGGIIGHQSGHGGAGAAIGAAVGSLGGMAVGEHMDKKFCPKCGASYTEKMQYCPKDGTELKYKDK